MQLFVLFKTALDGDGENVFIFMTVCDSLEACYNIIKYQTDYFNVDNVFIGNRDDYRDNRVKYVIEEAILNLYPYSS